MLYAIPNYTTEKLIFIYRERPFFIFFTYLCFPPLACSHYYASKIGAIRGAMLLVMEFMPFMFLIFSFQVAAGLTLYWVVSNFYSIVQQRFTLGWGSLPYLCNMQ